MNMFERLSDEVVIIDGKYYRSMEDEDSAEFIWGKEGKNYWNGTISRRYPSPDLVVGTCPACGETIIFFVDTRDNHIIVHINKCKHYRGWNGSYMLFDED